MDNGILYFMESYVKPPQRGQSSIKREKHEYAPITNILRLAYIFMRLF